MLTLDAAQRLRLPRRRGPRPALPRKRGRAKEAQSLYPYFRIRAREAGTASERRWTGCAPFATARGLRRQVVARPQGFPCEEFWHGAFFHARPGA